ncbi:MAG: MFS transporter [Firmicutes bacterium]|nr:MFS transporter [Bacillota bacterium]
MEKALATPTMRTKVLVLLSLGHLATDLAAGAWPVLLPILQASLHLSYSAAGVIALVFNVSSSVIQPLLGYWSDRVKSRWLLPAGVLLSTAGLALAGFVSTYWLILAAVFMSGLGSAAYHPEASKVSRLASGSRLATGMSLFIVGGALGAALGSLVMAQLLLHYSRSASLYFILPGLLMVVLFFAFKNKLPEDSPVILTGKPDFSISVPRRVLFPLSVLILFIVLRSWLQSGLTHFMPLYFVNYLGKSPAYAGSFLVAFMLAGSVGTVAGGPLADRLGRRTSLLGSTAVLIPLMLLFKYSTGIWTLVLVFITGMVMVSTMATTVVMGQELLPHRVGVASGLMTGFAIGMGGLGVTLLGAIADHFGAPVAVWAMTFLPVPAFLFSLLLPKDDLVKGD